MQNIQLMPMICEETTINLTRKALRKYFNKEKFDDYAEVEGCCFTCTMSELSTPCSGQELGEMIYFAWEDRSKFVFCNVVNKKSIPILEEFGFKLLDKYMGGHRRYVHMYGLDIGKLKEKDFVKVLKTRAVPKVRK